MQNWDEVEGWLRDRAHEDVLERGAIRPTLVAFAGARPLLIAGFRPFGPAQGAAALHELLAVALPLGADRLAVSFGGWSRVIDDPARATREILLIAVAEGGLRPVPRCTLTPFDHHGYDVVWGQQITSDSAAGWLVRALAGALAGAPAAVAADDVVAQAQRCLALGHELLIAAA
jgi:hypothetical protein